MICLTYCTEAEANALRRLMGVEVKTENPMLDWLGNLLGI